MAVSAGPCTTFCSPSRPETTFQQTHHPHLHEPPGTSHDLLHPQPKQASKGQLFICDAAGTSSPTCASPHRPPHGVTHLVGTLPGTTESQNPSKDPAACPACIICHSTASSPSAGAADGLGFPPLAGEGKAPWPARGGWAVGSCSQSTQGILPPTKISLSHTTVFKPPEGLPKSSGGEMFPRTN